MGKRAYSQAAIKSKEFASRRREVFMEHVRNVESYGRKVFEEGGRYYEAAGTKEADEWIREAAISKITGHGIDDRYRPTKPFQDAPWKMDPYGPWRLDDMNVDDDRIAKMEKSLKLDVYKSDSYEAYKESKANKPSLRDRLFGKALKNADEAKSSVEVEQQVAK